MIINTIIMSLVISMILTAIVVWARVPSVKSRWYELRERTARHCSFKCQHLANHLKTVLQKMIASYQEFLKSHPDLEGMNTMAIILTICWIGAAIGEMMLIRPGFETAYDLNRETDYYSIVAACIGYSLTALAGGIFIGEGTRFGLLRNGAKEIGIVHRSVWVILGIFILGGLGLYSSWLISENSELIQSMRVDYSVSGQNSLSYELGVNKDEKIYYSAILTVITALCGLGIPYRINNIRKKIKSFSIRRLGNRISRLERQAIIEMDTAIARRTDRDIYLEKSSRNRYIHDPVINPTVRVNNELSLPAPVENEAQVSERGAGNELNNNTENEDEFDLSEVQEDIQTEEEILNSQHTREENEENLINIIKGQE